VKSFENWCNETFGNIKMHKEIPIIYQNKDGVIISGIIDLLIESKKGCWIIDHKTYKPDNPDKDFWQYWPQLMGYRPGFEKNKGEKKVVGVGVHWVSDCSVSLVNQSS